jgi:acetyl-CoA synthetase
MIYYPSEKTVKEATIKDYDKLYQYSVSHPEEFWAEQAEHLSWYRKWDKVLDRSTPPFYKWFTGGKTNIILNAIDRHQAMQIVISLH